jgi:hypothetical protein
MEEIIVSLHKLPEKSGKVNSPKLFYKDIITLSKEEKRTNQQNLQIELPRECRQSNPTCYGSCVEGLVPGAAVFRGGASVNWWTQGFDLINGLIHSWVRNFVGYWEVTET